MKRVSGELHRTAVAVSRIRLALSRYPSSIQTVTVGSGVAPDHARFPNEESDVPKQARGLYHRSGIAPCPEGFYLVFEIIPVSAANCKNLICGHGYCISQLRFDDAIDRANAHTLG